MKKPLYDQFLNELPTDDVTPPTNRITGRCCSKSPSTGSTDDSNKGEEGVSDGDSIASPRRVAYTKEFMEKIYEPVGRSKVHGFDYDIMSLKMLLLDERSQYSFKLVGVVGMLGVGKTTLCRLILDEEEVKQRFVPRFWITMSTDEETKMENVVERMLECLGVEEQIITFISKNHNLPGLLYALHLYLKGKRYLILLDGVRAKDKYYEDLMSCLRDGHGFPKAYGGAVMVTSRDEEAVKEMVGEQNLHRLLPLSNPDSCWPIYQNLDSVAQDSGSEASKEVKEELLKKCGGLPLAARILRELKDLEKKQIGGSKEGSIQAPATSKEVSSQAPAASEGGPIQASAVSTEGPIQAPAASREGSIQAPAASREGSIQEPAASREGSNQASAASKEGSNEASVASKEDPIQASAASKEGSNEASAASNEGPIQASAASNEGPIQASAASKEVSSQASAASKEGSNEASAASKEASAASKEGSNEASAASKEVSSQASTASKEGSNQASTASNESDSKPATTN